MAPNPRGGDKLPVCCPACGKPAFQNEPWTFYVCPEGHENRPEDMPYAISIREVSGALKISMEIGTPSGNLSHWLNDQREDLLLLSKQPRGAISARIAVLMVALAQADN